MISKIAGAADREQTLHLFKQIVFETFQINPAFMNWSEPSIHESWDRYQFSLLLTEEGSPIAFICFQKSPDWTEILALGILRHHQGIGLMRSFLTEFALICGATSKVLSLEVHAQNQRAIDLYTKCGFKTVRIRKNYYSDAQDAIVMDLKLQNL